MDAGGGGCWSGLKAVCTRGGGAGPVSLEKLMRGEARGEGPGETRRRDVLLLCGKYVPDVGPHELDGCGEKGPPGGCRVADRGAAETGDDTKGGSLMCIRTGSFVVRLSLGGRLRACTSASVSSESDSTAGACQLRRWYFSRLRSSRGRCCSIRNRSWIRLIRVHCESK